MVDLMSQYKKIKDQIDKNLINCIESGKLINGPIVKEFSDNLKNYLKGNTIINQEIIKLNPGDIINIPEFNDENGVVEKTSNNTAWVFLENLGYKIKLNLA